MDIYRWNGILAQAGASQTAQPATQSPPPTPLQALLGSPVIFIGAMLVMMYFLFVRAPQQQRARQAALLKNLKPGDKVVTSSGIVGVVITVKDQTVSLRSADAKMEVTKSSVTEILKGGDAVES
jgi:preprotein translocase subunit YajC